MELALDRLIEQERPIVFECLKKRLGGESMLFASLWATNSEFDDGDYDEDSEVDDGKDTVLSLRDILNSHAALNYILNDEDDMFEERLQAFEWVQSGMPAVNFRRSEMDDGLYDD